jgi:hypothetical protein
MSDTETLDNTNEKQQPTNNGDFPSMGMDLMKKINIKISLFLFLIGFFIFSDVFINKVLPPNYHEMGCPTNNGTIVQLLLFVFAYICIDLLAQGEII